jgi:hypothetical protein
VREGVRWRVEIFGPQTAAAGAAATRATGAPMSSPSDAATKSAVREAVSIIESCFTDANAYAGCDTANPQVEVREVTADSYEVVARTPAGNEYRIVRGPGVFQRTCTAAQATPSCSGATW